MRHFLTTALMTTSLATAALATPATFAPQVVVGSDTGIALQTDHIWLAKDNGKAKGHKKEKKAKGGNSAKSKHDKAKPQKAAEDKGHGKKDKPGKSAHAKGQKDKVAKSAKPAHFDRATLRVRAEDVLKVRAPRDRDMTLLGGAAALGLLGRDVVIANVPEHDLMTYRNCPPGLAKKNPPCVPPGLAKKGVTYDQWVGYDDAELDHIWRRERDGYLRGGTVPDRDMLLLQSDQIATLYGLQPAPYGQRYGLIDGLPVLLDQQDYSSLLMINDLAGVTNLSPGMQIAPTAALSQLELQRLYRLPPRQPGYNYAVLNGQLVTLQDSAYNTLQLIRIARAIL